MRYIGNDEPVLAVPIEVFKRAVHLPLGEAEDDVSLELALRAAQEVVVAATGRPLTPEPYEFTIAAGTWSRWWFPCVPVVSLDAVATDDGAGGWTDLPLGDARLARANTEPQLLVPADWTRAGDLRVQATVGVGTGLVRSQQAIILLAKEWFEAGIAVEDPAAPPRLSMGALRLIRQLRYQRPFVTNAGGVLMAAALDRRLQLLRKPVGGDAYSSEGGKHAPLGAPVWGSKEDLSDEERWQADQVAGTVTTRFRVRYGAFQNGITMKDRIECDGVPYEIVGLKEIGRRRLTEITAVARTDR